MKTSSLQKIAKTLMNKAMDARTPEDLAESMARSVSFVDSKTGEKETFLQRIEKSMATKEEMEQKQKEATEHLKNVVEAKVEEVQAEKSEEVQATA